MSDGHSCTLTRTLDAPAAAVHQAWATPDASARWAYAVPGPVETDRRPGGAWKATMLTPDGTEGAPHRVVPGGRREPAAGRGHGRARARRALRDGGGAGRGRDGDPDRAAATCDTKEERDMAEQGGTMPLDSLTRFRAESPAG
ncbi:SRPBCC domain-containing protein [Streptomyces cellulosae]|uniref:SRPBCC domain-containing protein n=1 Tax=Streptomyces cellulosae TaxID=1968 RepID=A0ABW6JS11_STRCE